MTDELDENKKYYFGQIEDDAVCDIIKKVITHGNNSILIWKKREKRSKAEKYELIRFDSKNRSVFFKSNSIIHNFKKSKKMGSEIFFRIGLGRFYFFSTSTLEYNEENKEYSIKIKDTLYKGQQRGDFRIKKSEQVTITVKLDNKTYDGLDLSSGGVCFHIKKEDSNKYQTGKDLFNCTVNFNDKDYFIKRLRVASSWQSTKNYKLECIGLSFINLLGETEEELFKQINTISKEISERNRRIAKRVKA